MVVPEMIDGGGGEARDQLLHVVVEAKTRQRYKALRRFALKTTEAEKAGGENSLGTREQARFNCSGGFVAYT